MRGTESARAELAQVAPRPALKPVHGLKVKTVSAMTLAFSLLCLAAFAASRPPLPSGRARAWRQQPSTRRSRNMRRPQPDPHVRHPLRHDDARRFFFRGRLRKSLAKEAKEGARKRPAIGLLLRHAQQEDEQEENVGILQRGKSGAIDLLLAEFLKEACDLRV